jgi:membrane protease YdiL (CAAX protease family)
MPERLNAHAQRHRTPSVPPERLQRLAVACFVLWCAGAALTRVIGIWPGIGGMAIGLGIAMLFLARNVLTPMLRPTGRLFAWGSAAAIVMVGVTYGLYPLVRAASAPIDASVSVLYALLRETGLPWVPLLLIPFIIVSEELIWRGVFFEALLRRQAFRRSGVQAFGVRATNDCQPSTLNLAAAVVLSAIAYALAHAPIGSLLLTGLALACGLFWSALRAGTGSLIPPLVCHLAWDLLVFALRPLA